MKHRSSLTGTEFQKETYLIQLYNRAYLNLHPNPDPKDMTRYITMHYIEGSLHRNPTEFTSLQDQYNILKKEHTLTPDNIPIQQLYAYYTEWINTWHPQLPIFCNKDESTTHA